MNKDFKKFKIASEFAPIHIVFTDTDGKVLYANKAVEEITGFRRREIIGQNPRLWGKQMDKDFYKKFWRTIKEKRRIFQGEIKNKRKNGEIYTAFARIAPVVENKKLIGFVGIERDITKEKEVDKAKSEFVSLASHELKNPLSVISLYAEMLLRDKDLSQKQRRVILEIINANKKMKDIIDSLLNISKIELGKFISNPKKINPVEIIKNIAYEFKPKIKKKKIKLLEIYPSCEKKILIDPKLINIIFGNLLSNAVNYTANFGEITVLVAFSENLEIKISDTGIGIPKKEQNKVFTKLFRASNVQEADGTGLGLYMVKSLIEKNKGKIWFDSKENKGTAFYVNIPLK